MNLGFTFTMARGPATLSQERLYTLCVEMAGVSTEPFTPQELAGKVLFTPGPVTVQDVVTPEADTVRVEAVPEITRSG